MCDSHGWVRLAGFTCARFLRCLIRRYAVEVTAISTATTQGRDMTNHSSHQIHRKGASKTQSSILRARRFAREKKSCPIKICYDVRLRLSFPDQKMSENDISLRLRERKNTDLLQRRTKWHSKSRRNPPSWTPQRKMRLRGRSRDKGKSPSKRWRR